MALPIDCKNFNGKKTSSLCLLVLACTLGTSFLGPSANARYCDYHNSNGPYAACYDDDRPPSGYRNQSSRGSSGGANFAAGCAVGIGTGAVITLAGAAAAVHGGVKVGAEAAVAMAAASAVGCVVIGGVGAAVADEASATPSELDLQDGENSASGQDE